MGDMSILRSRVGYEASLLQIGYSTVFHSIVSYQIWRRNDSPDLVEKASATPRTSPPVLIVLKTFLSSLYKYAQSIRRVHCAYMTTSTRLRDSWPCHRLALDFKYLKFSRHIPLGNNSFEKANHCLKKYIRRPHCKYMTTSARLRDNSICHWHWTAST